MVDRLEASMAARLLHVLVLGASLTLWSFPESVSAQDGDQAKIRIESADQLPRHSYAVPESARKLVEDDAQFADLAGRLETDLRDDLARYEIQDRATLKEYWATLGSLALIDGDHEIALAYADSIRAIEDKPALRALSGTLERALAAAADIPSPERLRTFEKVYRTEIGGLPYDRVQAELKSLKGQTEILSPGLVLGSIEAQIEPAASSGEISRELANEVVFARQYLVVLRPVQEAMISVLSETIAAHAVEKPDIWASREVSLEGRSDLTPVVVGIWDSGVDAKLFEKRMFLSQSEIPDNGVDDDANGYVDDIHGPAYDLRGERTSGILVPLTYGREEEARFRSLLKGFYDLEAAVDSPEASAVRRISAAMEPEEFQPFFEGLGQYGTHAHGTHVAGIAAAGNPAVRLLIARITFDYHFVPLLPTVELARTYGRSYHETVDYFRKSGVRVVNMSWGSSADWYESALELNNAGGSPEERKALAGQIFDVEATALRDAMASAPEILFVAAAGNSSEDVEFIEDAPASFDLPNLLSVGAVDRAGDEAAFTSYGERVEVYANGYEVRSYVPGGEIQALSGTSMASPQVVNLAAKLLAVEPDLTVAQLREIILSGAEEKTIGEAKTIRLLNPRRSFELLPRNE
jgi:subtilisin family serine protease